MSAKYLIDSTTGKYLMFPGSGVGRIGEPGEPCCGCTPVGKPCGSCDPSAPAIQVRFSGVSIPPAAFSNGAYWSGADINGIDFCLRQQPLSSTLGAAGQCFYSYVGPPLASYFCGAESSGLEDCEPRSNFCLRIHAFRRPSGEWFLYAISGLAPDALFLQSDPADIAACDEAVTLNNTFLSPFADAMGNPVGYYEGTVTITPLTSFCEAIDSSECGSQPAQYPIKECAVGCDGCSEIYRGKFVFDGNDVLFCLAIQIISGVEGGPPTACIWSQSTDDFHAVLYCTVIDGIPTRVLDVSHDTYGVNSFTQVVGSEDCPQAIWTLATLDSGLTTASVADFEAAESCCDGPCEVTASNSGADNTGNRDQSWSVGAAAAYITTPFGSWVAPPTGAYWISHASDNVSSGTTHDYTTTITLCGTEEGLAQLYIPIELAADNEITDILINGNSTGVTVSDTNSFTQIYARYLPPGFWVAGTNTITVQTSDSGVVGGLLFKFGTPDCTGEFQKCKFCDGGYSLTISGSGDGYDGTYTLAAVSDPVDGVLPTCQWGGGDVFDGGVVNWTITYSTGGFHLVGVVNYDFDPTDYIVEFFVDDIDNPGGCPLYSEWTMITNEIPGSAGTASATTAEIP